MDPYATHIPILEVVCNNILCESVFEFGMGNFSTTLFSKKFKEVLSVEMQDEGWFKQMEKLKLPNTTLKCGIGMKPAIEIFENENKKYSCIFVDGHGGNRWECINKSFGKSDVIITHDTETSGYNWNLVKKPDNYVWLDIKDYNPWTSVLTCDTNLVNILLTNFKKCEIRQL